MNLESENSKKLTDFFGREYESLNWYVKSPEYGFVEIAHLVICHTILDIEMGWKPRH